MRSITGADAVQRVDILRYAAFSRDPSGGNPAGVVLDASGLTDAQLLETAARVGYSETAFLFPGTGTSVGVRYFSPRAEVPFCGHATIAAAIAHAERHGPGTLTLDTRSGPVRVDTSRSRDGGLTATLTSVATRTADLAEADLAALLAALRWSWDDLDPRLPPKVAYAGAWHPVIAVTTRERLADLDYDFAGLSALMAARAWTTVDLVWRESATMFHARNPFPPGGIVEDPATGAAAAAFGGYMRELGAVAVPSRLTIHQGAELGRPGLLTVDITDAPGIAVTGYAVAIPELAPSTS